MVAYGIAPYLLEKVTNSIQKHRLLKGDFAAKDI